jgi:hypothetical protein
MRRPGKGDQQPHQQRSGYRVTPLIEEADRNEAKYQVGTSPGPLVLAKYVECDDRNDQQEFFHSGFARTDLINKWRPELSKPL